MSRNRLMFAWLIRKYSTMVQRLAAKNRPQTYKFVILPQKISISRMLFELPLRASRILLNKDRRVNKMVCPWIVGWRKGQICDGVCAWCLTSIATEECAKISFAFPSPIAPTSRFFLIPPNPETFSLPHTHRDDFCFYFFSLCVRVPVRL